MSNSRVLVVGGTGVAGSAVVRKLAQGAAGVRVLTRRPEAAAATLPAECEVAVGDVLDRAAVRAALDGCTSVHLSLAGGADPDLERKAAQIVADLAGKAGLARITLVSGASVCPENNWYPEVAAKLAAEAIVADCGVPHAVFRPTFLMESLSRYVRGDRASVIGKQPTAWHWLAADDLAAMVSRVHRDGVGSGTYTVLGPEAMTMAQALQRYCDLARPGTKVGTLPFWIAGLIARTRGGRELAAALPFARYSAVVEEVGDPSRTNAVFGAPSTTLDQWSRAALAAV